jgi:DNA-binding PadR family transcriptional regulator
LLNFMTAMANKNKQHQHISSKAKTITKQVLLGLFEVSKDFANIMIDPYGKYNQFMGTRPGRYEYEKRQVYSAVRNLKQQGLVKSYEQQGKTLFKLTQAGKIEAKKQLVLQRLETKKIDGKWRVVIFDIPEQERRLRDNFRNLLKELEFKMLQASVWASPYDVFDELEMLVPDIKRHSWIKLLLVDVIVGEADFKKLFKTKTS